LAEEEAFRERRKKFRRGGRILEEEI
jgi:hypothetical protein